MYFQLLMKAAEMEHRDAMYWVGNKYYQDNNSLNAIKWFLRVVNLGPESARYDVLYDFAQFFLADSFKSTSDKENAIHWYKQNANYRYSCFKEVDGGSIKSLKELGVNYDPRTRTSTSTSSSSSNSYASHSTSSNSQSHKSSTISKSSTQKSNSSQRTTSRPINWATDVIMPPVIDFSNMPFNSVGTYPLGGGYTGTIDGGSYNSGGAANSSNSASRCTWCNGTGKVVKNDNAPANFGISKPKQRCPECGEIYDPNVRNHYHQTCSHCHGTGLR